MSPEIVEHLMNWKTVFNVGFGGLVATVFSVGVQYATQKGRIAKNSEDIKANKEERQKEISRLNDEIHTLDDKKVDKAACSPCSQRISEHTESTKNFIKYVDGEFKSKMAKIEITMDRMNTSISDLKIGMTGVQEQVRFLAERRANERVNI